MTAATAPTPRPRRWRRRLWRLLLLLVALRIALALCLHWLVAFGASFAGLTVEYRTASLSLLSACVQFHDLTVRDTARPQLAPLLRCEHLMADASMRSLLRGDIEIVDVAVTGAVVSLTLGTEGRWLLPGADVPMVPTAAEIEAVEPTNWHFDLPLAVQSATLHDLRLELREQQAPADAPPAEHWLADVAITDLGFAGRAGSIEVRLHDPQRMDHVSLHATTTLEHERASVALQLEGKGIRVASPLFAPLRQAFLGDVRHADAQLQVKLDLENGGAPGLLEMRGEVRFALRLDGEPAAELDVDLGPCTHGTNTTAVPFQLQGYARGLLQRLACTDGQFALRPDGVSLAATIAAEGLTLDPLRPSLAQQGVHLPKSLDASLQVGFDSRRQEERQLLDLTVTALRCDDGDEAVTWPSIVVRGLCSSEDATTSHLSVQSIEIDGPTVALRHLADGSLQVAGIRLAPAAAPAAAPAVAADEPAAPPTTNAPAPVFEIGSLQWRGLSVQVRDETREEPAEFALQDFEVQGRDLVYGRAAPQSTLSIVARVPGAIERLQTTVQVTPRDDGVDMALQLQSDGTTLTQLRPWLQDSGVHIGWQSASFAFGATAALRHEQGAVRCDAQLHDLRLEDSGTTLLDVPQLAVLQLTSGAGRTDIGEVTLDIDNVRIERLADGALQVAGLRVDQGAPTTARQWQVSSEVRITPSGAGEHQFVTALRIDGAVDRVAATGRLLLTEARQELHADLSAAGIVGAGIADLLPAGITCTLQDGNAQATVKFERDSEHGALSIDVQGAQLRDGERELAALQALTARVPSASAELFHLQSLQLLGLRAEVGSSTAGLELLGVRLAAAPAPDAEQPTAAATQDRAAAVDLAARTASSLPALRIDELKVEVARVLVRDPSHPDATPCEIAALLTLVESWQTAADKSASAPLHLSLTGTAAPVVKQVAVDVLAAPFALQPTVTATLQVNGIDTTVLPSVLPALQDQLTGTTTNAEFAGKVQVVLGLRRRDPELFDFSRPLPLNLQFEALRYGEPEQPPFFAVPELEVAIAAFDPVTGNVLVRHIELNEPSLRVAQTAEGLQFGGLLVHAAKAPPDAEPDVPTAPAPHAVQPDTNFAIDLLSVQGLQVDYRDDTTTPATHLPIASLDLELRDFSSKVLQDSAAFSFDLQITGGEVDLDHRRNRGSIVADVINTAGAAVTRSGDQPAHERRTVVEDIALRGTLSLNPVLVGQVTARIDGFELRAIRGLAATSGVQIADGQLDFSLDAELKGTSGSLIRATPVFTWLSISEPPDGPISTYLRLPAPLNTILWLLRDEAGEHRLPARLKLDGHEATAESIRDAAVEAVALLISSAVGSTPKRLLTSVTSMLGLFGKADPRELDTSISFPPGETTPPELDLDAVVAMLQNEPDRRVVLHHEPAAKDRERVTELVNPPAAMVLRTIAELRRQRQELLDRRGPLAAQLTAELLAGRATQTFELHGRLDALDTQLGNLEDTLDQTLAMLDEADGQGDNRRSREALRDLGTARLAAIRAALLRRLGDGGADRIELRAPRTASRAELTEGGRVLLTVR